FLYPIVALALFAAAGWFVARLLTGLIGLEGLGAAAVGLIAGLVVFYGLVQWPGRRWRVEQLLDDWICAHDYLRGRRADIDARLDRFAETLIAQVRAGGADEIVLVGHSLGAMLVLDLLVRALARDGDLGRSGAALCVLTVGATIPKFALHPRADDIRRKIARIADEPSIAWAEYQSRDDTISFYKFDPVALRRIDDDRLDGKPVIRRVQIHDMLLPETFARCRRNVLRLHYRSVMANDRRGPHPHFHMGAGPGAVFGLDDVAGGLSGFHRPGQRLSRRRAQRRRGHAGVGMTLLAAKVIWCLGVVGWFVIRYPHERRARRTPKLRRSDRGRELV